MDSKDKSRVFIIQSIAYADIATCERDLLIPIVSQIEGSCGKSRFIEDPRFAGDATPTENIYEYPSIMVNSKNK